MHVNQHLEMWPGTNTKGQCNTRRGYEVIERKKGSQLTYTRMWPAQKKDKKQQKRATKILHRIDRNKHERNGRRSKKKKVKKVTRSEVNREYTKGKPKVQIVRHIAHAECAGPGEIGENKWNKRKKGKKREKQGHKGNNFTQHCQRQVAVIRFICRFFFFLPGLFCAHVPSPKEPFEVIPACVSPCEMSKRWK